MKKRRYQSRRLNKSEEVNSGGDSWLLSYADMMSLLFALFAILYGMSKMNEQSFRALAEALSRNLSTGGVVSTTPHKKDAVKNNRDVKIEKKQMEMFKKLLKNQNKEKEKEKQKEKQKEKEKKKEKHKEKGAGPSNSRKNLLEIKQKIKVLLKKKKLSHVVILKLEERGLTVSLLTDKLLFVIGKAELMARCRTVLEAIIPVLKEYDNPLRIEGNTCNIPIGNGKFDSNWELSTMRATNVAKYLIMKKNIKPERISIVGYGEYQPMFPNSNEKNRIKNRRVDIVILDKGKASGKSH
ncbi:MAG: flagellar motor protein MotB [Candidatus Eremiobacteraeota bacterium]|nr:flagellar motor protein MotB [Candidatus Eremiobacteraeota bacterium]